MVDNHTKAYELLPVNILIIPHMAVVIMGLCFVIADIRRVPQSK